MARVYKRVVQLSFAVLPALGGIMAAAGFYVGNKGGNPGPWFGACGVSFFFAILIPVLCWWVLPRLFGGDDEETSDDDTGVILEDSPNAEIRGNIPKKIADKGIKLKRSPGAKAHLNVSEEAEESDDAEGGNESDGG